MRAVNWIIVLAIAFLIGFCSVGYTQERRLAVVAFIASSTDANGVATTYTASEFRVVAKGGTSSATAIATLAPKPVIGENMIDATSLFETLPPGEYDCWLRLRNAKGWGAYAGPVRFVSPLTLPFPEQPVIPATTPLKAQQLSARVDTVVPPPPPPPPPVVTVSIFAATDTPATLQSVETLPYELGVKFQSSVAGKVRGIKFYKGALNVGPHSVHLWNAAGGILASEPIHEVTLSGWQERSFTTPVVIEAGKTYTASYFCPVGRYSFTTGGFNAAKVSGVLSVPVGGGVFKQGTTSAFPSATYANSNYWIDIIFEAGIASLPPTPKPVTLAWDPPTANADGSTLLDFAGYVLYRGQQSTSFDVRELLGKVTEWNGELLPGPYWFQVRARDTSGNESAPTATLAITVQ